MTNRIRNASAALLCLVCLVALTSAFSLPNTSPDLSSGLASLCMAVKPVQQHTMLTLADRVAYQRAVEEVYWRHRIWPKERPDPKPSLDEVMPSAQLEKKVEDYLRDSQALEDYWQQPLSTEQLQAEMERMAQHTKQPEVLHELFEALGNDPFVIAECLARPALSERLVTNFYANDQRFHGELKRHAEADLRAHRSVRQMKKTTGNYSEIELVRSDNGQDEENRGVEPSVKMSSGEWDESVQKLATMFGGAPITQIKTGVLSSLQENEERYYATAIIKKSKDQMKLATVEWRKEPLESWRARAESQMPKVIAAATGNYTLPAISDGANGCTDDTWTSTTTTNVPSGRSSHTAVWTGSEMIVWGGTNGSSWFNTGGRYNPSTDSWTAISTTNAPVGRDLHTAVWTGSEMIVWGGFDGYHDQYVNTGGRYNPGTDTWTATSTTNAPTARAYYTAVWTSSEMIVWGGFDGSNYVNTGGRYNPSTDSWTATSTTNAPSDRNRHTAVWTGSEMIIWGGIDGSFWNTGGRYNPGTDSWTATSTAGDAPTFRADHVAVWTGSEMIVWGGYNTVDGDLNSGGRYNPGTDSWAATALANAPLGGRSHTVVWTGSDMIVWGGDNYPAGRLNTGGRYNVTTDSWTATSTISAPDARDSHTAVWTGSEMIVWGGYDGSTRLNTGGRYCALVPQSAFSRKTHGAAGTFDIPLLFTGGVECRSGGATNDYQMIINFMNPVTVGRVSVTSGTGRVSSFSVSGPQVTVNLTGVANVQRITVTLFNVNDGTRNVPVSMGVLVGDVNGNATVNVSDVSLTKAQVGQPVTGSNFREDVNANGSISVADVAQVKANVGTALPPPPHTLWYNGDWDHVNGLPNERNTAVTQAAVYDDFNVPAGQMWNVTAVFSDNVFFPPLTVTGADWEIRTGVSEGNAGTLIASGTTSSPVVTQIECDFQQCVSRVEVTGLNVFLPMLPSGQHYWLNVTPVGNGTGRSFNITTSGFNCVGTPCGNDQNAFFNSTYFGAYFTSTANEGVPGDFSNGVIGTAVPELHSGDDGARRSRTARRPAIAPEERLNSPLL